MNKVIISNIEITNPQKIMYKKQKITKLQIVNYYDLVSKLMLPYLKNRLLSVIRCHKCVDKDCFFKKHITNDNKNINKYNVGNKSKLNNKDDYFYINTKKELINQSQMDTIEFHIWGSNINSINNPDIMVFDLDPDKSINIKQLRQGVKDLKYILDSLKLKSFLKISGGKGYHILVPFRESKDWNSFSNFSKNIAELMVEKWPEKYTINSRMNKRKGKIFIDYLRNKKGATCIAPYSLRSRETASISVPIFWSELDTIKPNEITIFNIDSRLNLNPWSNFFKVKQKLF